jgi:hypothetical protein
MILEKKSNFPISPKMFKRNSWIYWQIPEDGISNMGAACKDSASHYLQLKIKKIKPIIKKPVLGIFGKTSVELEIDANVNKVSKAPTHLHTFGCNKLLFFVHFLFSNLFLILLHITSCQVAMRTAHSALVYCHKAATFVTSQSQFPRPRDSFQLKTSKAFCFY